MLIRRFGSIKFHNVYATKSGVGNVLACLTKLSFLIDINLIFFIPREVIEKTKEMMEALQKRNAAILPSLAIIQVNWTYPVTKKNCFSICGNKYGL